MPGMPLDLALPNTSSITRRINALVIHCSATPSGNWLGGRAPGIAGYRSAALVIDGWHQQRGFKRQPAWVARHQTGLKSIGYHYVVDLTGRVWLGRNLCEVGAHVAGRNADTVGICLVGGAELDAQYTAEQWASLRDLVLQLCNHLSVPMLPYMNGSGVCGHRDMSPDANRDGQINRRDWLKTCPGFDVAGWLSSSLKPADRNLWSGPLRGLGAGVAA